MIEDERDLHEYCKDCDRQELYPYHHPFYCPLKKVKIINFDEVLQNIERSLKKKKDPVPTKNRS